MYYVCSVQCMLPSLHQLFFSFLQHLLQQFDQSIASFPYISQVDLVESHLLDEASLLPQMTQTHVHVHVNTLKYLLVYSPLDNVFGMTRVLLLMYDT